MRHPLHSICPYFAMFPEDFVTEQLLAHTQLGDLVFDPFSGRGTTVFESLLSGRKAIGMDINPVAACVSGAKACVPKYVDVRSRLNCLSRAYSEIQPLLSDLHVDEFFTECFHTETLSELIFLRNSLNWRHDTVDRFISAILLGVLHGESHKSPMYLSNRMPRTISTKRDYSVRWWRRHGLTAPYRKTFEILERAIDFRFAVPPPALSGQVKLGDSRSASVAFSDFERKVSLIVTSPPYIDTTDYSEDQWLRLWFLGGDPKPILRLNKDDRITDLHTYWSFLAEVWRGCEPLLAKKSTIVIRIGGQKVSKEELFLGLKSSLKAGFTNYKVRELNRGSSSEIKKRQTNSFRPGTKTARMEHDFTFTLARLNMPDSAACARYVPRRRLRRRAAS